ncbi:hypothetical protein [Zooshikella ganghwensis]|uniref:Uncharacterized protein n=1 Tax=Zooshikella ganghwensis TaxID=202772 RepID=A0A4V1IND6_9GAMM|nr:hypothetical protein [Zooshikella ganghwensis]RDH43361.1 hypothetical protein B9G39_07875 [Zooshikella ganghwensis]
MTTQLPLPEEKKIVVLIRVEPGCLGPEGKNHIEPFCIYMQNHVASVHSDFAKWKIRPRLDKDLPELEYFLLNKKLTSARVEKYLHIFNLNLPHFEDEIHDLLDQEIEQFHLSLKDTPSP